MVEFVVELDDGDSGAISKGSAEILYERVAVACNYQTACHDHHIT
jgi:hypothetical protein